MVTLPNEHVVLTCLGAADQLNRVEATPSLDPASWETIASIIADGDGNFTFTDTAAPGVPQTLLPTVVSVTESPGHPVAGMISSAGGVTPGGCCGVFCFPQRRSVPHDDFVRRMSTPSADPADERVVVHKLEPGHAARARRREAVSFCRSPVRQTETESVVPTTKRWPEGWKATDWAGVRCTLNAAVS